MAVYSARGFTTATSATANHGIASLWNPDANKRIKVIETGIFKAGAGTANDSLYIVRCTTKGTAGTELTPAADNSWEDDDIPSSGALLEMGAFSSQPTLGSAPFLFGWVAAAAAGSGMIWPTPRGLTIPPGQGLVLAQRAATIWPTSEVYFVWEE